MIASFAELKPKDLTVFLPDLTLCLFPIGGLEAHGPHLPIGTKIFQAEALAKELAEVLQAKLPNFHFVLMPLLPFSVDSHTNALSIHVRGHVVRDAVVDQCSELVRMKFKNFAAVSSHVTPKQLSALEDAAKIVNRKRIFGGVGGQLISVSGALVDAKQVFDSPMISLPNEHGGARDTGWLLAHPVGHLSSSVDERYRELPAIPKPRASAKRFFSYLKNELDGYWGAPALADPAQSRKEQTREIHEIAEKMIPWLEKGKGQGLFRSGYGYFPANGSFFKAYVLATLFFVIMLLWAVWSMKDAFEI